MWSAIALFLACTAHGASSQVLGLLSTDYAPIAWKMTFPGEMEAGPVLSDDEATVFACFNGPIANEAGVANVTGQMVALDAATGAERWRFINPYREPFFTLGGDCPVKKGTASLLVVSNSRDVRERMVMEVSASTGEWLRSATPKNRSEPVDFSDYHGQTRVPCAYRYPDDDERRGQTCDYPFPVAAPPAYAHGLGTVFIVSADKHLYAVSTTTGRTLPFTAKCPEARYVSRYQPDGSIDVNGDPMRNAMEANCKVLLSYNASQNSTDFGLPYLPEVTCPWLTACTTFSLQPVLTSDADSLIIITTEGLVLNVDPTARRVRWERELGGIATQPPLLTSRGALILHAAGRVHAWWPNGTDLWAAPFEVPNATLVINGTVLFDRPAVTRVFHSHHEADGRVYVQDDAHWLYALNHDTGAVIWRFRVGERVYTIPLKGPTTQRVYFSSRPGHVFALDCAPGRQFVLDRVTYRCGDLGVMVPTQRDLCEELEHPCPPAAP